MHGSAVTGYRRTLDLSSATATVSYAARGVTFERRYFVSNPDSLFVIELSASQPKALSFSVTFGSQLQHAVETPGDVLRATGEAPVHAEPSYRGAMPNAIVYETGKGTRFAVMVRVVATDGAVTGNGGALDIDGATRATLLVSIATSFAGYDREPGSQGLDERAIAHSQLDGAASRTHVRPARTSRGRLPPLLRTGLARSRCRSRSGAHHRRTLAALCDGRRRSVSRAALLPVRALSADQQLAHPRCTGQPAGALESAHAAAMECELHDQHQRADELLAVRNDGATGDARITAVVHREPRCDGTRDGGEILAHARLECGAQLGHLGDVEPRGRLWWW